MTEVSGSLKCRSRWVSRMGFKEGCVNGRLGLRGSELVKAVVQDWEETVKRVASQEIGEKVIVCGKAAKWWDAEIKEKIRLRRQVYKEISSGREDKWGSITNYVQKSRNWFVRKN